MSNFEYDLEWRPYPKDKRYIISNKGDIISFTKIAKGRLLAKGSLNNSGYAFLSVTTREGKRTSKGIHRVVVETFIGNIPKGMTVNHIDGDKQNNSIKNLEICSYRDNLMHAKKTGLNMQKGDTHSEAKLKCSDIPGIVELYKKFHTYREIGKIYGISPYTVGNIVGGQSWVHVTGGKVKR